MPSFEADVVRFRTGMPGCDARYDAMRIRIGGRTLLQQSPQEHSRGAGLVREDDSWATVQGLGMVFRILEWS